MNPEGSDPEQLAHVQEILEKMNAAGVVASDGRREGDKDWEDESDEEEEEGEGDDVDME